MMIYNQYTLLLVPNPGNCKVVVRRLSSIESWVITVYLLYFSMPFL